MCHTGTAFGNVSACIHRRSIALIAGVVASVLFLRHIDNTTSMRPNCPEHPGEGSGLWTAGAGERLRWMNLEWPEQLQGLSSDRMLLSILLLLSSIGMMLIAIFIGIPVLPIAPAKLAVPLSLSTLLGLSAFASIRGINAQVASMLHGSTAPVSVALIVSMLATLTFAAQGSYVLVLLAALAHLCASVVYSLSAFPGGVTGAKLLLSSTSSIVMRFIGIASEQSAPSSSATSTVSSYATAAASTVSDTAFSISSYTSSALSNASDSIFGSNSAGKSILPI